MKEILDMFEWKPVLEPLRHFQANQFAELQDRFPDVVVEIEDDTSPGMRSALEVLQKSLDVIQFTEQGGKNNKIKGLAEWFARSVHFTEVKIRVLFSGNPYHFRADVDTNTS